MRVRCSFPSCTVHQDLPWYNALIVRWKRYWLCPEHRYSWDEALSPWMSADELEDFKVWYAEIQRRHGSHE